MTKLAAFTCGAALLLVPSAVPSSQATQPRFRVLVFTKTAAFRHDSTRPSIRAVRELGAANGIAVDATEDGSRFRGRRLDRYDAVVFLLMTGDVLNGPQQAALERYVRAGGGYAGRPLGGRHGVRLALVRRARRRVLPQSPAVQQAAIEVPRRRLDRTVPPALGPNRRVVQLQVAPARRVRVLAAAGRGHLRPGGGAMAPTIRSPGLTRTAGTRLVHRRRPYVRDVRRAALPRAPARRAPLRRGRGPPFRVGAVAVRSRRATADLRAPTACAARAAPGARRGPLAATAMRATGNGPGDDGALPVGRLGVKVAPEDRATGLTATAARTVIDPLTAIA